MIRIPGYVRSAAAYLRTLGLVLLLWWGISAWLGRPYLLPKPGVVGEAAWQLMASGEVAMALLVSGKRLLLAYLLAAAVGVPLGVAMGLSRSVSALFDWLLEVLRPISGIAWIPVLLVVFGVSDVIPVSIIFYAAIFPFVLNSASGVRHVDPRLTNAARALGAGSWRTLLTVTLPAATPDILTGARIAAGNCWMALIVAELVGAPNGLGFAIGFAQELGNATLVLAWIAYVGVSGYLLDVALRGLQARLTPWTVGVKMGR